MKITEIRIAAERGPSFSVCPIDEHGAYQIDARRRDELGSFGRADAVRAARLMKDRYPDAVITYQGQGADVAQPLTDQSSGWDGGVHISV